MNYESKYLGSLGLTSAEANYTANIVKELCDKINNEIGNMSLFSAILTKGDKDHIFMKERKVEDLQKKCMEEGNLYALSAWLREGIKEKDELINKVNNDSFGFIPENSTDIGREYTNNQIVLPTEASIRRELPINELAEFLSYEAKAAHIGKKVHPNGIFEKWFRELKNTPTLQLHPDNKEMIITLTQVILEQDLYKIYFELQKEYREAEQKVNYYKAKIKNLLSEKTLEANNKNREARDKYQEDMNIITSKNVSINLQINNKRVEKTKELSELKIIIPNSLQSTLDFIQEYSKK